MEQELCDGVVCFAGIDWWYHSQGHNDHQIMKRLVHSFPVIWVNSIGMRFPKPGKSDIVFVRYLRKFKSILKGLKKDPSGILIFSPIFFPVYTKTFLKINGFIINLQVNLICRFNKVRNPAAWITVPTALYALKRRNWRKVIFNRCDNFSNNPETDQAVIRDLELQLFKISDHVLYTSRELMESEMNLTKSSIYLGHGVDTEHFINPKAIDEIPEFISSLPRPVIGYYGALDGFTIDLELMIKTARKIFPGTLLIIGLKSMDISKLLEEKNVVYLEPVPYNKIPQYAKKFDVGIMPWLRNKWISTANPIKLREYLAIGFPIVSIDFPELRPFKHLLYCADTHDGFLKMIDNALEEQDSSMRKRRQDAVSGSSWDNIAGIVTKLFSDEKRFR